MIFWLAAGKVCDSSIFFFRSATVSVSSASRVNS